MIQVPWRTHTWSGQVADPVPVGLSVLLKIPLIAAGGDHSLIHHLDGQQVVHLLEAGSWTPTDQGEPSGFPPTVWTLPPRFSRAEVTPCSRSRSARRAPA